MPQFKWECTPMLKSGSLRWTSIMKRAQALLQQTREQTGQQKPNNNEAIICRVYNSMTASTKSKSIFKEEYVETRSLQKSKNMFQRREKGKKLKLDFT